MSRGVDGGPSQLVRAGRAWARVLRATGPEAAQRPPRRGGRKARQRGVALLIVMASVAILAALTGEFAYESRGTMLAAANAEAEVHAFFHARSAMEIARLVVISQKVANQYLGMAKAMMPNLRNPKVELWAYACKFAEIFNSGKVEAAGLELFDLAGREGVGLKEGSFTCEANAEDGRINVNQNRNLAEKQNLFYRLYPVLRSLRGANEEDDRDAIEAVLNLIDYADADDLRSDVGPDGKMTESGGGEARAYVGVDHEAKNALFDTIEELRMVPGIDDDTFCLLKDRITVYLTEKINVNTADLYVLRALICENLTDPVQQQACQQSVVLGPLAHPVDIAVEWIEMCRRLKWGLFTPPFSSGQSFVSFFNRLPAPLNTEVRINGATMLQHVSTDSKVIRVKAEGTYGKVTKKLEGVIDTSTGRYTYWREN